VIPENAVKKVARDAKVLKEMTDRRVKDKKDRAEKRKLMLANGEKYDKEYSALSKSIIDAKRAAKDAGNFFVEGEPRLAFAIRTRG
jgi:large subunit ribosomal protein L7e